jgi:electron transfer flavoprotein alpha subunit
LSAGPAANGDSRNAQVLTFSERPDVASEVLAAARAIAASSGLGVVSVVVGEDGAARAHDEIARGADRVLLASDESLDTTDSRVLLAVLAEAVRTTDASVVLVGSTRAGAEVAARLSQRLGVASASECLSVELDAAGDLIVERFVYGGRFVARRALRSTPKIAALGVKRFDPLSPDERRRGVVTAIEIPSSPPVVKVVDRKQPERSQVDIGKADVIVSAGRGLKSKDDLALLGSLARALGGEIAGSRPLVEMGWITRDRQVGLSGETVKSQLYVACGVSGQIEHIAGMRPARVVVAINTNPDAPIHQEADFSIVGDLYEIVPALIAAIQERRTRPPRDGR